MRGIEEWNGCVVAVIYNVPTGNKQTEHLQATLQILLTMKSEEKESQRTIGVLEKERVVHAVQKDAFTAEHIFCRPFERLNFVGPTNSFK